MACNWLRTGIAAIILLMENRRRVRDDGFLSRADWVQLLRSEISQALSVLLTATAIVGTFVVGLMAVYMRSGSAGFVYGGCYLALFWITMLIYIYCKQTIPRHAIIDIILHDGFDSGRDLRREY